MRLHWFPISVIVLVVVLVSFVLSEDAKDKRTRKQLPAGTLFLHADLGDQNGWAAITPDGRRWFRAAGAATFQEVKP